MIDYGNEEMSKKLVYTISDFEGVDFSKAATTVAPNRSPEAINMTRDEVGKQRKRMGYEEIFNLADPIYGIIPYEDDFLIHAGTNLMLETLTTAGTYTLTTAYADMNEHVSQYWQNDSNVYILDGKTFTVFDGTTCEKVSDNAYVPLIKIAGTANGGGTVLEDVNLMSDFWEEKFQGDDTSHTYQLSFTDIGETIVAKKSRLDGVNEVWDTLTAGHDYTVATATGIVTFVTAIGVPIIGSEDRLGVTASKDRSASQSKINKCDILTGFGLNGQENQLFVTGNPDFKNRDFWSALNNPTYMPDLNYSTLGQDNSAIMSYLKLGTKLGAVKDTVGKDIYIRDSEVSGTDIIFPVSYVINGSGAICKYSSQTIGEPLFLTQLGIQTITVQDLTLREYEQIRGERINKRLLAEANIENAMSCVFKDLYLIAVNDHVYTLDRLQKAFDPNAPYSTYQYGGDYWDNIPATCFLSTNEYLYFGTSDGSIMRFFTDETESSSYNDNGVAITASWELPEFFGNIFWENKNIKFIAVKLKSAVNTGIKIYARIDGIWELQFEDFISFGYVDFNDWNFDLFNFSTDTTPKKAQTKTNIRKVDKTAFKLVNDELDQPFGIYDVSFIYTEKGTNK